MDKENKFKIDDEVYFINKNNNIIYGQLLHVDKEHKAFTVKEFNGNIQTVYKIFGTFEDAADSLLKLHISQIRNGVAEWRLDDKKEHEELEDSLKNVYSIVKRSNGELSDITDRLKKHYSIKESSVFKCATFFFITTIALLGAVIALSVKNLI